MARNPLVKMGRPSVADPRVIGRTVKLSQADDDLIVAAALAAGQSVGTFMREAALTKAKRRPKTPNE